MDSFGKIQLMGTRNYIRYESALHAEVEALRWAMGDGEYASALDMLELWDRL